MMKTGKNKRQRQNHQQSGRPVVLTFYVARPTRDDGATTTVSAHDVRRRGSKPKIVDGRSYNRRAELLEYSRQLRALARQTTTSAAQPAPPPRSYCRDTNTIGVVPDADHQRAAKNRLSLAGRRHEPASSQQQQQIRQRCFGRGGGWSWKRILELVFPFTGSSHGKSSKRTRSHDDGRESDRKNSQKGWPAALLLGKLTL